MSKMVVMKRNGEKQDISFDKIVTRIHEQCVKDPQCLLVDYTLVAQKVIARIYDGVKTTELDELTANICISLSTEEPEYGTIASRIIISNNQKNTPNTFLESMTLLYSQPIAIISEELYQISCKYNEIIESTIDYKRDYYIDYFGYKTLEKSYLKSIENKILERPQHMWMRVAIGIHGYNLEAAFETYHAMSNKNLIHATPTLFHSGTTNNQFLSCFLLGMDDSIDGIYKCLGDCARISKWAGGIGVNISNIRSNNSHIRGTNGISQGIVPMLKVFNDTAVYVNQCFHPSTIVYTDKGAKYIKDVSITDSVITHDGNYQPVLKIISNNISKKLLIIKQQHSLYPTKCTSEHYIYCLQTPDAKLSTHSVIKNYNLGHIKPKFIMANELKVGDLVCFPINKFDDNKIIDINYLRFYGICLTLAKKNKDNVIYIKLKKKQEFLKTLEFVKDYLTKNGVIYNINKRTHKKEDYLSWDESKFSIFKNNDSDFDSIQNDYYNMTHENTLQLIRAIIEPLKKNTQNVNIKSKNYLYICSIKQLFQKIGYLLKGYKSVSKMILNIPLYSAITENYINNRGITDFAFDNNMLWTRVKSIREQNYKGVVYDLNIKDNHNYLTELGLVHNSGKRNGSFAIYIEPWHADILSFLELKKNHGDESARCRDLFYALWIPDLFMERVESDSKWSLMDPDECPGLTKSFGDQFNRLYLSYESENKYRTQISARELFNKIVESQIETGTPYIGYKDAVNKKNNQQNLGTIMNSNLCIEINEYSDENEYACCTLGSLGLPSFVIDSVFNFSELMKSVRILVRNLNIIIDKNFYPVPETKKSNLKHRPIGIGIQGLADVYMLLKLPFDSHEASQLNVHIFACIYYTALSESVELSKNINRNNINSYDNEKIIERVQKGSSFIGAYSSFEGSPISKGFFQFDMWGVKPVDKLLDGTTLNWQNLREKIISYGIRNSLLVAPMPTASTSQILGYTECFEPLTSNIYLRRVLAGEFIVVNKFLVEDLKKIGLWNKQMKDTIILNNGSIQNINTIPENVKNIYKTVWDLSMKNIINQSADRGAYICQTQSLNLFMAKPDFNKITSMHFYAWKKGLKTGLYYLRTLSASKAQQVTIEPEQVCKRGDPNCMMCSS
jgi:ribonucleoside-diphosphate reductase alpha subunit